MSFEEPRLFEMPAVQVMITLQWGEATGWRLTVAHRAEGDVEWLRHNLAEYTQLTLAEALDVLDSEVERRRGF